MRLAVLLLAAGCFGKPGFTQRDAADDVGDDAADCLNQTPGLVSTARRVSWPQLPAAPFIEFGDETAGVPMPSQLSISGVNLIAPPATCTFENQMGVGIYPMFQAAAGAPSFTTMSLTKIANGAAYASWRANWSHDFTCTAGMPNGSTGESRYSMFPDGRILRTDIITPSTTRSVNVVDCTRCMAGATNFQVTSYSAFAWNEIPFVQRTPVAGEIATPASEDLSSVTDSEGGCIVDRNGARLTVLWDQRMPAGAETTRFRVVSAPSGNQLVFVADLDSAASLAPPTVRSIRTTMVIGAPNVGTCDAVIARAHAVRNFPAILVDGNVRGASPDGTYALGDRSDTVELHTNGAALPPGFLIEARMPGTKLRTSRAPADVIWHHEPSTGTFYVFFKTGLGSGESIMINSSATCPS